METLWNTRWMWDDLIVDLVSVPYRVREQNMEYPVERVPDVRKPRRIPLLIP